MMIQTVAKYQDLLFITAELNRCCITYMYSMVPQNVWVIAPSLTDSLHKPKSVSLT